MPRMQPPRGWIRGSEATARLRISESLLSRYVSEGKIRRYVPHGRKYGFYNEDDVKILEDVSAAFPGVKHQQHRSFFSIARRSDISAIAKIDHDAIHPEDDQYNDEFLLRWQQRNPETLFALRDINGTVVGFVSILPLTRSALDRVIRGEVSLTDLVDEDIPLFAAGATNHLHTVSMALPPQIPINIRDPYRAPPLPR